MEEMGRNDRVLMVDTLESAMEVKEQIELEQTARYVAKKCPKDFGSTGN